MRGPSGDVLVLFPGALGDFLCFLPALLALRERRAGRIVVAARGEWLELIRGGPFDVVSIDSRAVAELFAPLPPAAPRSLLQEVEEVQSWTGYGDEHFERCIREATNVRTAAIHPFRDFAPGEHAADYYARCLAVTPVRARLSIAERHETWAVEYLRDMGVDTSRLLFVHAGSGSPSKNWEGFESLVLEWRAAGGDVIEIVGPAEYGRERLDANACVTEPLPRVAALLGAGGVYAGNDSGITHLAAAAGARGVAVVRAENAAHWAPRGAAWIVPVIAARCRRCGPSRLCTHAVPVATVKRRLGGV